MGSRAPEPIPGGDQCVTPIPAPPTKISGNPQIHNFSYMPDSLMSWLTVPRLSTNGANNQQRNHATQTRLCSNGNMSFGVGDGCVKLDQPL